MKRLWVAAAAAAVAALYLLKLMFSCKRGPRSGKGKHYSQVWCMALVHALQRSLTCKERPLMLASSVSSCCAVASRMLFSMRVKLCWCWGFHRSWPHWSQDPAHPAAERLLDEGSNEARDAARADGGAHSSVAAPASGAGTRGSEPVRVVAAIAGCETQSGTEQTLAGDEGAVDSEAVDITYLQSLLDKELGQPKFAVPKTAETSASPQGSPSAADAFSESAVGPERTSLHLTVTDGPAAGVTMQSANDQTEVRHGSQHIHTPMLPAMPAWLDADASPLHISPPAQIVIGRLPASTLSIVDQEVSGRHAVIRYDDQQDCWKVVRHDSSSSPRSSLVHRYSPCNVWYAVGCLCADGCRQLERQHPQRGDH